MLTAQRDDPAFGNDRRPDRHGYSLLVLGVVLLGAALRIFCALRFPFDEDELYTFFESRDLFATTLRPGIDSRPLYYLLQHPLLSIFPFAPFALRLLALVFGILGVWATCRLGSRLFGARAGVAAGLLAAISPWHLYASTTARYYSLIYLCSALTVWGLIEAYESDAPRVYLLTLAALLVGSFTHPSFIIGIMGAVLGLTLVSPTNAFGWRWPSRRAWAFLWLPYAAALLLEVIVLKTAGRSSAMANLGGRGLGATIRLIPAMVDWMTVSVFIAAFIGAVLLARRPTAGRRVGVMTLSAAIVAFIVLFIASLRTGVYADYGVGMLPLVFVAAAGLITGVAADEREYSVATSVVMAAVIVAGSLPSIASYLSDGMRFDYRPAYARIRAVDPHLGVFAWPRVIQLHYANDLRAYELRPDTAYLDSTLAAEKQMWAVVPVKRQGISADDGGILESWLAGHCRFVESFEPPRFDYRMYRVELRRCAADGPR